MADAPAADALSRALGALTGLALGDALGMPTQSLSRAQIVARWGPVVGGLEDGPPDQPLAPGLPAGTVTDDTEQAVLLGHLLVEGGGQLDEAEFARRLIAWEESMRARGSLDLLGPSTKAALTRLLDGVSPAESGVAGTTNGAAMRVTPVGIANSLNQGDGSCSGDGSFGPTAQRHHPDKTRPKEPSPQPTPASPLIDAVVQASRLTHNTSVALAGAAAVAAAVSAGVGGGGVADAVQAAVDAARAAATRGRWVAAADVSARIEHLAAHGPKVSVVGPDTFLERVSALVGTSLATQESVPAAFAVILGAPDDPWLALRLAASIGGDCDTIAAMAGAVLGACWGVDAFPEPERAKVAQMNALDLPSLAAGLLALRQTPMTDTPMT